MPQPNWTGQDEPLCKICFCIKRACLCPECPQCGENGNPKCYKEHPLRLNCYQLVLRTEKKIERMGEELDVEKQYLQMLNEQPESYCEDWSEV